MQNPQLRISQLTEESLHYNDCFCMSLAGRPLQGSFFSFTGFHATLWEAAFYYDVACEALTCDQQTAPQLIINTAPQLIMNTL